MISGANVVFLLVAGSANVLGALALLSRRRWSRDAMEMLVIVAAGFMIAVSLVEIMPVSVRDHGRSAPLIILAGYFMVHLTQHTLSQHFHFGEETHEVTPSVGQTALLGLLLHTFVDGVAISSGFLENRELGVLVFSAIALHKFPEGLAVSSICLAAGMGRTRALLAAAILGLATVLGGLLTGVSGTLATYGLPLSGGVTLYVAASNLVPEFQSKRGWRVPLVFLAGCGLYFLSRAALG